MYDPKQLQKCLNEACEDWLGDSSTTPGYPLHTLSAVKRIKLCDDVVKNVKNRPKTPKTVAKQVKLSWTPRTPCTPSRTPSPPRTPYTLGSTPYTPSRTPSPPPLASPASNYEENEVMPCLESSAMHELQGGPLQGGHPCEARKNSSFDKSSQVKTIRLTFDVCDEKQRHITQTKTEASSLELQGGPLQGGPKKSSEGFRFSCSNCHESWPLNQTRKIAQHMSKGTAPLTKAIRTVFSSLFKHWSYKVRLLVNPQSYTVSRYVFK